MKYELILYCYWWTSNGSYYVICEVGSIIIKQHQKLEWFQNAESMMNHHLAGLLGLGCLAWSGHQIHIALPINKLLDAGVITSRNSITS